jgi:hypothetical protein
VVVLNYASHVPIIKFVLSDPKRTALLVLAYFAVGAIWGVVKWVFFVHSQLEQYNEAKARFLAENKLTAIDTPKAAFDFREFISRRFSRVEVNPQVSNHKADVTFWMSYWPFSALWTLINDPVRKFFRMIYTYLQGTMQSISDRMFKHASAELGMADNYAPPEEPSSSSRRRY